eukprot:CAMPEP_0117577392 /NCGR_PEP_ID=MMETSP0784-20121206/63399_1 /TAXON_ID=39447 /ORGANISM="" /LENGTH=34 /DNA_ID= /DNA_START= /DNA_END= /DNA_ORIENTATION=
MAIRFGRANALGQQGYPVARHSRHKAAVPLSHSK